MKKLVLGIMVLTAVSAFAGEGMWMPQQIPQLADQLRKDGIQIDPNRLSDLTGDPMGAVVSLGGCTASFVSPDGLIVTNHHCGFGALQFNSSPEHDYITNGFLAKTRAEELPAGPGQKVWVTNKIEDVTARVTGNLDAKLTDAERARTITRRENDLVTACEKPGGLRCRVAGFFEGSQYLLTTQLELSDIRLVYAPANSVGDFGGDIDNFEWPRHTGDFSFLRAYQNGQPYHPQHYLKVSTTGMNAGDLVIVAGYPGRTFRYRTAAEVRNFSEFVYPVTIRYLTDVITILDKQGAGNRDVQIKNASRVKSLNNTLKNYQSVNEGFGKDHIYEARVAREQAMHDAIGADPSLKQYAGNLDEIAKLNTQLSQTRERDSVVQWLVLRSSPMLTQAFTAYRLSVEKAKKSDADREMGFQERDWTRLQQGSDRAQRTMDLGSDRAAFRYFVVEAGKLPADQRIEAVDKGVAAAGGVDPFLDRLYASTKVGDQSERAKMFGETTDALKARNDSMINFAAALLPLVEANDQRNLAVEGAMSRYRPGYFELLRRSAGRELYPDANGTLRITFGKVQGYSPRDATFLTPQTSLTGVLQKDTGKDPFDSPKGLLAAARDSSKTTPYVDPELHAVPVDFLSSCDTTGGNSGSPTLNAKGELCGLLFDGNYESIDADFLFNPDVTRSIHVDSQYMLWVMDAVDGAQNLIREMGVTPKFGK